MTKNTEGLSGDAAWRAHKAEVAKRNDAAQKRGRAERAARDAQTEHRRREAEQREFADLPEQPEP